MGSCASNPESDDTRRNHVFQSSYSRISPAVSSKPSQQQSLAGRQPLVQNANPLNALSLAPPQRSPVRNSIHPGSDNVSFNSGNSNPQSPVVTIRPKTKIIVAPNDSRNSNHSTAVASDQEQPSYSMLTFEPSIVEVQPRHETQEKVMSISVSLMSRHSVAETQAFKSATDDC